MSLGISWSFNAVSNSPNIWGVIPWSRSAKIPRIDQQIVENLSFSRSFFLSTNHDWNFDIFITTLRERDFFVEFLKKND